MTIEARDAGVAIIEIHRPPANYFDVALIEGLADALNDLETGGVCRAVVLASEGKHFCAGADFTGAADVGEVSPDRGARALYGAAVRLFETRLPVVAAVQGAAIGGGLGLALAADFRVATTESTFSANFSRLGLHHGFGLTVTLPRVVGAQRAADILLTGRRINGVEAFRMGLVDRVVDSESLRPTAILLATEIATGAPLAVQSIRTTLRAGLAKEIADATEREREEQARLRATEDFAEGVAAASERRLPVFNRR